MNLLGTIKLPVNMKMISQNLPGSNYESDKPRKEPQRNSAMKKESGPLHKINEENEYDDSNQVSHPVRTPAGQDSGPSSELEKRRNHRQPKIRNDVFKQNNGGRPNEKLADDYKSIDNMMPNVIPLSK